MEPEDQASPASDRASRGAKVFVADDDDELRTLIAEALRCEGYTVIEARDGAELLALLADTLTEVHARPDVVVTDVCMPKLSGLGVLQELKRTRAGLSVVLMTAFPPTSVDIVAKRLGAVEVLAKPFDVDRLKEAVSNARRPR
jgi:DNA-binding NtrC family response regulator